jgi:hypothetical protein
MRRKRRIKRRNRVDITPYLSVCSAAKNTSNSNAFSAAFLERPAFGKARHSPLQQRSKSIRSDLE